MLVSALVCNVKYILYIYMFLCFVTQLKGFPSEEASQFPSVEMAVLVDLRSFWGSFSLSSESMSESCKNMTKSFCLVSGSL